MGLLSHSLHTPGTPALLVFFFEIHGSVESSMEAANASVDVRLEFFMEVSLEAPTKASRDGAIFHGSFRGSCFRGTFRRRCATGHVSVNIVEDSVEATPTGIHGNFGGNVHGNYLYVIYIYGNSGENTREDSVKAYSRGHLLKLPWKLAARGSSRGAFHIRCSH